jgi:hypothetical protein
MRLGKKQELFSSLYPLLVPYLISLGYQIRSGDLFRDERVHGAFGIKKGYGRAFSCHKLKLAIDLNVMKNGIYLRGEEANEAHHKAHDYWDSLGGSKRILRDMNHYSLLHNGYR